MSDHSVIKVTPPRSNRTRERASKAAGYLSASERERRIRAELMVI
jgi:hypothetical protein